MIKSSLDCTSLSFIFCICFSFVEFIISDKMQFVKYKIQNISIKNKLFWKLKIKNKKNQKITCLFLRFGLILVPLLVKALLK